jgi:hypothetical protein
MKSYYKPLIFLVSLMLLASCSKQADKNNEPKKIIVEKSETVIMPLKKAEKRETVIKPSNKIEQKAVPAKEILKPTSAKKPQTASISSDTKVLYKINFASVAKKSEEVRKSMEKDGFQFKSDAGSQRKLELTYKNDALNLKGKAGIFGIMLKELDVKGASKIRITWGVNKFPKNASYKNGINNEALMVYVYFGKEKLDSGSLFIPGSPYFLGLFLGENEDVGKSRLGNHFKEGGRFICLGTPQPGETVVSEFDLTKGFKESFGNDKSVPDVSGIALEVETSKSGDSDGFIKSIEFLK